MLNVGLCAYGMSGRVFHAPLIAAEPALHLAAIVQRQDRGAAVDWPAAQILPSVESLFSLREIDLVVVNTPHALHYPMARAALLAGKHVAVEKPFTLTLDEGKQLIELAKSRRRLLAVFHNKRLESDYLSLAKVLAAGDLGRVVEVEWHYDRFRTAITHKRWKEDPQPGAGTWYDLGVHMVDGMLQLFGRPQAVCADMRSLRRPDGATDYFNVRFDYPDLRVILRSSTLVLEKGPIVAAHGTGGSFVKFGADPQEARLIAGLRPGDVGWDAPGEDERCVLHRTADGKTWQETPTPVAGRYQDFYRHIAAVLAGDAKLQFGPHAALQAVEMLLAGEASHAARASVAL